MRLAGATMLAGVLTVSLAPTSRAQPGSITLDPQRGPAGATVTITGTELGGATAVSFGAVPTTFTVDSDHQLTATVPQDAATAPVHVETPGGPTASTDPFIVQPNILVILTDDQRWDTLGYLPVVDAEIVGKGITFTNAFAENPLCCPSRASFLTGQASHTTGVFGNGPPEGGYESFQDDQTLATWLDEVGYETVFAGKYLNGYAATRGLYKPPGWDLWRAKANAQPYYDYKLSINGMSTITFGSAPEDYATDVLAGVAEDTIRVASPQDPLFLWVAPPAPHEPFIPAPRDEGTWAGIEAWRPPSYNERDVTDKPAYIQATKRLNLTRVAEIDAIRQHQLETLGAVDDLTQRLLEALADTGRLHDTIVVFASDNGFLWGEHRRKGKVLPYEESIRIPLLIRWDRIVRPGVLEPKLVENIDLAPTLVDAASASGSGFDGRSLMPLLQGPPVAWRSNVLIEHAGEGAPPYCGVRTETDVLVHYGTNEEEYYRLGADRFEVTNRITDTRFQTRIGTLRTKLRTMCSPQPPGVPPF